MKKRIIAAILALVFLGGCRSPKYTKKQREALDGVGYSLGAAFIMGELIHGKGKTGPEQKASGERTGSDGNDGPSRPDDSSSPDR